VVIARLHPDFGLLPVPPARFDEQFGLELFGQEIVSIALVDEQVGHGEAVVEQRAGVVGAPFLAVVAEVMAQRLFAPWAVERRNDRRKGRHRPETVLTPQADGERAMPAHRMPHDRLPRQVGAREIAQDQRGQLVLDIGPHPVMFRPWFGGRIDVEAGTQPEIPGRIGIVGHILAAGRGVGGDEDHAMFGAGGAIFALFHHIGVGAGQTRQIPEHRQLRARCMTGDEHREGHVGARRRAGVPVDALRAAVTASGRKGFDGHQDS